MTEKQLKDIFKQGYSFQNWRQVLEFVFGKVEYFSTPNNPFKENKKVISGRQYGLIKLEDAKSIALFEVQVDNSIDIERNRQGLREIAAKHIDQNITHGAIVFFHSLTQENYRFTFIAKWSEIDLETGELQKGETQKKRYTYLLGSHQSGTTAAKRLLELANRKPVITIEDIIQAFSVEALTKEFFKKYKEHYERFWRFIDDKPSYQKLLVDTSDEKNDDEKRKPIRDFSKKLLGRIVFLHFLQKKGWMGCPVLPTKKENDEIWMAGNPNFMMDLFRNFTDKAHLYSKCLTTLFFNTLNEPDRTNNIFSITNNRVPYLNGGLFDNDQQYTDVIDFPVNYFQDLLEFFEQYNFTIDENSPDEQEVGIDPEMLGHIFENLLEENRESGAFYTPKKIVQYMCQESLVQYLKNYLPEDAQIEEFIRQQNVSVYLRDKANATHLNHLLDEIKICDPAIGSGAFPIGILQEIYKAKIHIYPHLKALTAFDPTETKKKIIEESIYGVDMEHGAVEIARLRFWLALVVDEDKPQPLPNLDYKIMQGNSLLECFEGIDLSMVTKTKKNIKVVEPERDLFGNITDNQMKMTFTQTETVREIQGLMKKYFSIKKSPDKAVLKTKINEAVHNHIDFNLELRETQLARLISEAENESTLNAKAQKKLEELRKELTSFAQKRAKLHKIQNTEEKPFFIWHLFFKDVFDKDGFDIVIGNPPYIQLQKMGKEADVLQDAGFKTFVRTGDIYCLFYEKGFGLLKKNGILSYITSNSWLRAKYGASLRKFLRDETNPIFLINFEDTLLFQSATVETNILVSQRSEFKGKLSAVAVKSDLKESSLSEYLKRKHVNIEKLDDTGWTVAERIDFNIMLQIEEIGTSLKNLDYRINRGILTGFNDAFVIPTAKRNELVDLDPANDKIIKKFLSGRDLSKYSIKWDDTWIINTHNGVKSNQIEPINVKADYPSLYKHFLLYREKLEHRSDQGNNWWNLRDCSYILDFEKPKLLWAELSDLPKFVYDDQGYYTNKTTFILTGERLKFLLVLLNSKLLVWYFSQISTSTGMGTTMWSKYKVEEVPIKQVSDLESSKFERLANILLFLNATGEVNLAVAFEDLANMMVYELYFEGEMKAKEIDVLQFVTEKTFPDITHLENKKAVIQKMYYELQEKGNPIRNRILVASSRSKIIERINAAMS